MNARIARLLGHRQRTASPHLEQVDPRHPDPQEHRLLVPGPDRLEPDQCPADVTAVEVKMNKRFKCIRVSKIEASASALLEQRPRARLSVSGCSLPASLIIVM